MRADGYRPAKRVDERVERFRGARIRENCRFIILTARNIDDSDLMHFT